MLKPFKYLLASLPFFTFFAFANTLTVNLSEYSVNLSYPQTYRLHQVISDTNSLVANNQYATPFWLRAQLIQPDLNEDIKIEKSKILEKLEYLAKYHPEFALKADSIRTAINENHFNHRYFISLDNDQIRLESQLNPLLKGTYTLITPPRPKQVYVVGTLQAITPVTHQNGANPLAYLDAVSLPSGSDITHVFVIQPDGYAISFSNPIWQNNKTYLAPGAIILAGFDSLPKEYASLNQQVAELLRYMEPIQENAFEEEAK
ncbi:capsule biosynthesis GfcC D2 domain-containing protein [Vibrio sp. F74]|uniref:capsule biosynthesis GfcC D2 domain-containing protein n=1 Tax=Vibrio sp. F74 TaxID=700020 RepID=UPI0035F5C266